MTTLTLVFSGFLATSTFLYQKEGFTKHECVNACFFDENCSSLFFNTVTGFCQLEKFVYTKTSDLSVAGNVLYFAMKHELCPTDYTYWRYTKQCLKRYDILKTFPDAQEICEGDSGHLVYPKTADINTQAVLMMDSASVWIGAEEVSSGVWQWLDGQTVGPFTNWRPGTPHGEDVVFIATDKLWDDHYLSKKFHFICQIDDEGINSLSC